MRGDAYAHHHRSGSHLWLLPQCAPGFQPGGSEIMTWARFCGPGGKMPPDTAGKDACRYKLIHQPQAEKAPG